MQSPLQNEKLWQKLGRTLLKDNESLQNSIVHHLEFSLCKNRFTTTPQDIYQSLARAIRDRLVERWNDTQQNYHQHHLKRVYYLSLEYLMGRSLESNVLSQGMVDVVEEALKELGYSLEEIKELEHDAGLGNGGLGRLAACFLDSMATLQLPAQGYGIRYEYGIFEQKIEKGEQVEYPDHWLAEGFPWEIPRKELAFPVRFYGSVSTPHPESHRGTWENYETVLAVASDLLIPGYQNKTVNTLRLWSATPSKAFDLGLFNNGDYFRAVEEKQKSHTISSILYPNDKGFSGKELRLKQQYFFVAASLEDIIRRYRQQNDSLDAFADQVAIQLNDTHPSIAIAELMRLFVDEEGLSWEKAWDLTTRTFAYTNHTVLPEALEKWSVQLLEHLLPRHLQIIYQINDYFLADVRKKYPHDEDRVRRMSLVEEGMNQQIRMPYLAIVGSHHVNGVSGLHSELLKKNVFSDFYDLYPERFCNITNGITPRRWLQQSNPELSGLITLTIGNGWKTNLSELEKLLPFSTHPSFQEQWQKIRFLKKQQWVQWFKMKTGVILDPHSLFDVQIKRIHEYKRQLLNLLHVIALYLQLRESPEVDIPARTVILGGKAAPGYYMAKLIIRLTHDIARVVNNDPMVKGRLRLIFLENYGVSLAEKMIPATDISQHISTAGTEASGTGNMKFSLNGSLILGTWDGATIEIVERVGRENSFIFGLTTEEVEAQRQQGYRPSNIIQNHPLLHEILERIHAGFFSPEEPDRYEPIYQSLIQDDHYLLLADFKSYLDAQHQVGIAYQNPAHWAQMSICNTAHSGYFSSDRTIREYAEKIWGVTSELSPIAHPKNLKNL